MLHLFHNVFCFITRHINWRPLVTVSLSAWISVCIPHKLSAQMFSPEHFNVNEVATGVYSCTHRFGGQGICNSGVIHMGEYTVVIDPFMTPVAAKELLSWIQAAGLPPVRFVINTHYYNDHVRGNQVFGSEVRIVSTP